ncbi:Beta-tubulin folding cofactor E [Phaffia rhodozyma]|uniref:Leucine-rich repeat-containing protein 51 n=1 Tax=Phaffia rhodozyma TaxID=264483 RepID=A0A0F7SN90_PHARH|nr:Beta-tubulin folding cofactor E [Phaffia rhodozyma]
MSANLPYRILVGKDRCTVRFEGLVQGTDKPWLGVEWDDPSRGKHDGEKDGVRYFTCRIPAAGSFIRPTSVKIIRPTPFLGTLKTRYRPPPVAMNSVDSDVSPVEGVFLGGSNILVEAPNLDKIRRRLMNLVALRTIGVDEEAVAGLGPGEEDEMRSMGTWESKTLNLAHTLFSNWTEVAQIVNVLCRLETLNLNANRLATLREPVSLPCFGQLKCLMLNNTLITWEEVLFIEPSLPNLTSLELSSNRIEKICFPDGKEREIFPRLEELRLEWNEFTSWDNLNGLVTLRSLRLLSLSANRLPALDSSVRSLPPWLKFLNLANNVVAGWKSIDVLGEKAFELEGIVLRGNPLFTSVHQGMLRAGVIARLGSLRLIDGSDILDSERKDTEMYYLSRNPSFPENTPGRSRWDSLVAKYGVSENPTGSMSTKPPNASTLGDKLININLIHSSLSSPTILRVLPSMTLKICKLKISRLTGLKPAEFQIVYLGTDDEIAEHVEDIWSDEKKTLGELGAERGGRIRIDVC